MDDAQICYVIARNGNHLDLDKPLTTLHPQYAPASRYQWNVWTWLSRMMGANHPKMMRPLSKTLNFSQNLRNISRNVSEAKFFHKKFISLCNT
jgi:hypothetical protein